MENAAVQSADLRVSPGLSQEIQENLCGNPTGKTSDKQVYSVVEEILEHKDMEKVPIL